jgi:predicted outer membrane repeat protein
MRSLIMLVVVVGLVLAAASALMATTWHVKADGTGDRATIAAAVSAAASGDTISLANGTYSGDGNRDIQIFGKALTILSEGGNPALCTISCGGSVSENHEGFDLRYGTAPAKIKGITITGAYSPSAGAVYVTKYLTGPVTVNMESCIFTLNTAAWAGGALMVTTDCTVNMTDCHFIGNSATSGGGLTLYQGGSLTATGCSFDGNTSEYGGAVDFGDNGTASGSFTTCVFTGNASTKHGGAIYSESGSPVFSGCFFIENSAGWSGGAVYLNSGASMTNCISIRNTAGLVGSSLCCAAAQPIQITNCSFVADSLGGAVVRCGPNVSPVFDRTIIAFGRLAYALSCDSGTPGTPTLTCCDIYGNSSGNWIGCIAGQASSSGNMSEDPKFCDIPTGNVSVEDCSPCLAAHNSCSQDIGAIGSGCLCGAAVEPTTWGALKALYK